MNWKLVFDSNGVSVLLKNKAGNNILCRPFKGWERREIDDDPKNTHLRPLFALKKGESISQDPKTGDLIYKKN